jgi:hypothetical protein
MKNGFPCPNCRSNVEPPAGFHKHLWRRMRCSTWASFKNPVFLFHCTRCPALKAREVIMVDTPSGRKIRTRAYYIAFDKFELVEGSEVEVPLYAKPAGPELKVAEVDIPPEWNTRTTRRYGRQMGVVHKERPLPLPPEPSAPTR